MHTRRFLVAAAAGSAAGAGAFLVFQDGALEDERWARVVASAVVFGLFMAAWNSVLITADARQRTSRNIVFEHTLAEIGAVMVTAWALVPALEHLRWEDLIVCTAIALPVLGVVWLLTRKQIKGADPHDLFA